MKLILHIGTHKTGTTALQQFLHFNRDAFAAQGIHYATPLRGVRDSNFVANALNVGENGAVRRFFRKQVENARRRGAHTLLISAENFYAMSVQNSMQRREICRNAMERDRALIETLQSLLPQAVSATQVVCYFRRPDRYAESLYSQHVKRGVIFDGTFEDFLPIMKPALFYHTSIGLWSDQFGRTNCAVRVYDSVGGDIVSDFLVNGLGIRNDRKFANGCGQPNERVGRDLLEFKRLRNQHARFSERDIERAILRCIDGEMGLRKAEPTHYQDYLSPSERAALLRLVQPEMEALQTTYGVPPFPAFDLESAKANWRPYPGLSEERRREIERRYDRINGRMEVRFERLALRSAGLLRRNVPGSGVLFDALKRVGAKRGLHGLVMGLQRRGG
jgi:hypothetical protein